jgi:hypothetical protein
MERRFLERQISTARRERLKLLENWNSQWFSSDQV